MVLSHDAAHGSLAEGTSRGGSAEVLNARGWRWSRSLECWFLPRSREQPARRGVLTATQEGLQEAVSTSSSPSTRSRPRSWSSSGRSRSSAAQLGWRNERLGTRAWP